LAERWSVSDDGKVYSFTLRDGVTFHDGSSMTAADVKASYDRIMHPPAGVVSARMHHFADVASVETPDDHTVVFKLNQANAAMPTFFASPWNCIYSAAKLAEDPTFPVRNVLGTGPFRFGEHVAGSEWVGERYDGYFLEGRPYVDKIHIVNMKGSAAVNALSAQQIDFSLPGLSAPDIVRIKDARPNNPIQTIAPVTVSVMFAATLNAERPPFNDIRVRQALNLAIDREGGAEALQMVLTASSYGGFLREGSPYARSTEDLRGLPGFGTDMEARREKAKALLAEAGVPDLKLTFVNRPPYAALGVFLIDQWRRIGVAADQTTPNNEAFFAAQRSGDFDATLDAIAEFSEDPALWFARLRSYKDNPRNLARVNDPAFDDLYEKQLRASDESARRAIVGDIEAHLLDEAYMLPLFWSRRFIAVDENVHGLGVATAPNNYVGLDFANVWLSR
jgi:peptide/nickel transport system substrate-binding protein